jgi:hypothetical protein
MSFRIPALIALIALSCASGPLTAAASPGFRSGDAGRAQAVIPLEAGAHPIEGVDGGARSGEPELSAFAIMPPHSPSLTIAPARVSEPDSGTAELVFPVMLSSPSTREVRVRFTVHDSTATLADRDYLATRGALRFAPGETMKWLVVQVVGDLKPEDDEFLVARLSNPAGATIANGVAVGTILGGDLPVMSIERAWVLEGNAGTTPLRFAVSLSRPVVVPVSVEYRTVSVNATVEDRDFIPVQGRLTFAAGETRKTIEVAVIGDDYYEPVIDFMELALANPVLAILGNVSARGTIVNDDPVPAASVGSASVIEGSDGATEMVFPVRLSNPHGVNVLEVPYETIERSAKEWVDYGRVRGSVMFPPKSVAGMIRVPIRGDLECEPDETFWVRLTAPTWPGSIPPQVVVANAVGVGTILDDDCVPLTPRIASSVEEKMLVSGIAAIGPNPSRGPARIDFALARDGDVRLSVLDVQGREVAVLAEGARPAGRYRVGWESVVGGAPAPAGLYFVRMHALGKCWARRLVIAY